MGYSHTAEAGKTMNAITKACLHQTGQQNVYKHNNTKYMWEINQVTHKDGSITGTIHRYVTGGIVKAGSFKIAGSGRVISGIGLSILAGGSTVGVKQEKITLQKYKYGGWNHDTGKPGEIIYVDMADKHPDPMKKLLWGYNKNGSLAHGDYVGMFTKVGSPITFQFPQTGKYAADEKRIRHEYIQKAIRSGKI